VTSKLELGIDLLLQRRQTLLLQASTRGARERRVELRKRDTAPQREGALKEIHGLCGRR
jgi:hypothetical protein